MDRKIVDLTGTNHADSSQKRLYVDMPYVIGSPVYLIKEITSSNFCDKCGGIGTIADGVICPVCGGKHSIEEKKYVPYTTPAVVKQIKITISAGDPIIKFILKHEGKKINRTLEHLFFSYEAALKHCDRKNSMVEMAISDIKIPPKFLKTPPCARKINKRMIELETTGHFKNIIEVDPDGVLVDGYTTYILAKGLGWDKIKVIRRKPKNNCDCAGVCDCKE